jgi:hypothetical protein
MPSIQPGYSPILVLVITTRPIGTFGLWDSGRVIAPTALKDLDALDILSFLWRHGYLSKVPAWGRRSDGPARGIAE